MTMLREGWFCAQGVIGYAVIYPWFVHHLGSPPISAWLYAGLIFGFGATCTGIRKLTTT